MTSLGSFDYVIAGAGTAGCVLANRLSADPDVRVLLLEAGGNDDWIWIHIPVGYLYCIGNPRTDWMYKTEAEPGLNGRSIGYARGKVLGGCSSINAMVYMRGQKRDYDEWAELTGDSSWRWENVLPVFRRSEDYHKGADEMHGAGGEWRVERQRLSWELLETWRVACEQCGIPKIDDFNRGDNEGSSFFEVNQRKGVRWNATKAFLRPIMSRPNLTVLTHCLVKRVRFDESRRATGIEFSQGANGKEEDKFAEARIETILAAGSIGSPQLMQISGLGNAEYLQELNIPIVQHLPGVGENLQDHLQVRPVYKVQNVLTMNTWANSLFGKMQMALMYALQRRGPLTMAPSQLGTFTKSDPSYATANIEYHVQPLSLDKFGDPLHTFPAFTASVCNLRPTSRGSVRIKSADPHEHPAIAPNYLATDADRKVAADSLRLTRKIVASPALAKYQPQEWKPGPQVQNDADLAKAAGDLGATIFHPVGTCKMGRADEPMAVVDTRLRVRGIERLRVIDASVMPTITSGNTNSPTIMIAERAADILKEDRKRY